MFIYYLAIFLSIIYGFCYEKVTSDVKMAMNIFYVFLFVVIFGFRFEVGVDWFNYINVYNRQTANPFALDTSELGFKLINLITYYVNEGIVTTVVLSTLLFAFFTIFGVARLGLNPYYFFVIVAPYHFVMSGMNYTRQAIALSVMMMAFSYLVQEKKNKFIIMTLVAGLFHTSALCFFPLYFVNGKIRYILFSLVAIVPLVVLQMFDAYSMYVTTNIDSAGLYLRVLYLLPCAFFILLNNGSFQDRLIFKRLRLMVLLSFPFLLLLSKLSTTLADRFAYYFILLGALIIYHEFYILGGWNKKYLNCYGPIVLFGTSLIAMVTWHLFSGYVPSYMFDHYFLHWYKN